MNFTFVCELTCCCKVFIGLSQDKGWRSQEKGKGPLKISTRLCLSPHSICIQGTVTVVTPGGRQWKITDFETTFAFPDLFEALLVRPGDLLFSV